MNRPIEHALESLIPRNSGLLPPELLELAASLLAQSRNKCSNLKTDEEAARTYACANLACERLKTTLDLPPIEPRPPIPPRIYTKLYSYFDRTLVLASARQRTQRIAPAKSKSETSGPVRQRSTPTKEKSLEGFQTNHRTPRRGLRFAANQHRSEIVPKWVIPSVRLLCQKLDTPKAIPHVLAGVESVLTLLASNGNNVERVGKLPGLIAAVWFFVVVKMRGRAEQGKENLQRKKLVRDILAGVREDAAILSRVGEGQEGWIGWEVVDEKDVNEWRKEIVAKEWRQLDWFKNITEGGGVEGETISELDQGQELSNDEGINEEEISPRRVDGRPGSMYQERYDYLSKSKKDSYEKWRLEMIARLDNLAPEATDDRMDLEI